MDGNNSLKRVAPSGKRSLGDTRPFDSDYILSREFVDKFANEVKSRQKHPKGKQVAPAEGESDDEEDDVPATEEGDLTNGGTEAPSACASHWKAASAEERKRMWAIFLETGIFACACRHGLMLWIADMVRSGEL